ncbi:MAG: hypothetical protein H7831_10600 [Magnetococcus sp. WYHC-3]
MREFEHGFPLLLAELVVGLVTLSLLTLFTLGVPLSGRGGAGEGMPTGGGTVTRSAPVIIADPRTVQENARLAEENRQLLDKHTRAQEESGRIVQENTQLRSELAGARGELERLAAQGSAVVAGSEGAPMRETLARLLDDLRRKLADRQVEAEVDETRGVLYLPGVLYFGRGASKLSREQTQGIKDLGEILGEVLPCYAGGQRPASCGEAPAVRLAGVFVEGQTRFIGTDSPVSRSNWTLAMDRARLTFEQLLWAHPSLLGLKSADGNSLFRVVALANDRDLPNESRRVELRFIVEDPRLSATSLTPQAPEKTGKDSSSSPA